MRIGRLAQDPVENSYDGKSKPRQDVFVAGGVTRVGFITIGLTWFKRTHDEVGIGKRVIARH